MELSLRTGLVGGSGVEDGERDLVIAGGGPAALSASIYAGRYGIDHLVLESYQPGGQAAMTALVENFPGYDTVSGGELASTMREQAVRWGAELRQESVAGASAAEDGRLRLKTDSGEILCRSLIIATGAAPRKLGVPGEDRFYGRGVSYCATCDAPFFKGQRVLVVGGGDSAVKEGLHLAGFASEVTLVHRRDALRAEPVVARRFESCGNCSIAWSSTLREIRGTPEGDGVGSVVLDTPEGERELPVDGVFIYVGRKPATGPFEGLVALNEDGTVRTDDIVRTSDERVFAAGDVTDNPLRQIITAAADGARAATAAFELLQR